MEVSARIEVDEGRAVTITWEDGRVAVIPAERLRRSCPCADCQARPEQEGPNEVAIADARLVGGYGITFTFDPDGHRTGIFTFDQLRQLG